MEKLIATANVYNYLAAFYCEPDAEVFWNADYQQLFYDNCSMINPELSSYANAINMSINETTHLELLQEYTKIFLGPFEIIAHPYASIYLEGYSLNGEVTQNILHFYNNCGLLFDENVKDLPDNIVVVFQFLHYLLDCEINGNDSFPDINWAEKRQEFFKLYVSSWVPKFTEKIINGTNNMFYKNLAILTNKFLEIN